MDQQENSDKNQRAAAGRGTLQERNKMKEVIDLMDSDSDDDDSSIEVVCVKKPAARLSSTIRPDSCASRPVRPLQVSSTSMLRNSHRNDNSPLCSPTLLLDRKNDGASTYNKRANDQRKLAARKSTNVGNTECARKTAVPVAGNRRRETINVDDDEGVQATARPSAQEQQLLRMRMKQKGNIVDLCIESSDDDSSLLSLSEETSTSTKQPPSAKAQQPATLAGSKHNLSEPEFDSSDDEMATLVARNKEQVLFGRPQAHRALNRVQIRDLRRQISPRQRTINSPAAPKRAAVALSESARHTSTAMKHMPDDLEEPVKKISPSGKVVQKVQSRNLRLNPKFGRSSRAMQTKTPPAPPKSSPASVQTTETHNGVHSHMEKKKAPVLSNESKTSRAMDLFSSDSSDDEVFFVERSKNSAPKFEKKNVETESISGLTDSIVDRAGTHKNADTINWNIIQEKSSTEASESESTRVANEEISVVEQASENRAQSPESVEDSATDSIEQPTKCNTNFLFEDDSVETAQNSDEDGDDDDDRNQETRTERKRPSMYRPASVQTNHVINDKILTAYASLFPDNPDRELLEVEVRDLESKIELDILDIRVVTTVEHLTKEWLDERGLPVKEIVVHGGTDEILYKLRVDVKQSEFEGGGFGAFLTYQGALKLKKEENERRQRMLHHRVPHFPKTTRLLDVADIDGIEKTLRITGENLHGNNNNCYWPRLMKPMKAKFGGFELTVSLTGRSIYADDQDEEDALYVEQKLSKMKSRSLKPIGFLGIHTIEDYVPANHLPFDMKGCLIHIGRYGPFRNQDRKAHGCFQLKSFLFRNLPNRYPFEASAPLEEQLQIIDVTDDITGLPHHIAKANIPMYVNEVGHSLLNKQTVFSTDSDNGGAVNYNIALYDGLALEKDSCIELLANYFDTYEETRKLEGYGLDNLYHGLPCGEDLARRIQNGISDRDDILHLLDSIPPIRIADAVERIDELTHKPIAHLLGQFLSRSGSVDISCLQISANRRIQWLGRACLQELQALEKKLDRDFELGTIGEGDCFVRRLSIIQAREVLSGWTSNDYVFRDGRVDNRMLGSDRISIAHTLRMESQEEVCYELRDKLVDAFHDAYWCPISRELMNELIEIVHMGDRPPWCDAEEFGANSRSHMATQCLRAVAKATENVHKAMEGQRSALYFSSGLTEDHVICGKLSDILAVCKSSDAFFLDCTRLPKSFVAEVACRLTYLEALHLVGDPCNPSLGDRVISSSEPLVMVRTAELTGKHSDLSKIASVPCTLSASDEREINVEWYLLWQVAYPAVVFIRRYAPTIAEQITDQICDAANLKRQWIDFALDRGIRRKPAGFSTVCVPKRNVVFKEVSPFVHHHHMHEDPGLEDDQLADPNEMASLKRRGSGLGERATKRLKSAKNKSSIKKYCNGNRPIGSGQRPFNQHSTESASAPGARPPAACIWTGAPDETHLPGQKIPMVWPKGWIKKVFQRASGATKGGTDRYWYSPIEQYKLRSIKEVQRYFECLEACANDERLAWKMFKGKR